MGDDALENHPDRLRHGGHTSARIDGSSDRTRECWGEAAELRLRGRYAEALAYCERALKLDPDQGRLWVEYGWALLGVGRSREGLEAFVHALTLNPDSPDRWVKYGTALLGEGRTGEGLGAFVHALSLNPCSADLWGRTAAAFSGEWLHQPALKCYLVAATLGSERNAEDARNVTEHLQRHGLTKAETDRIVDLVRHALPAAPSGPQQMLDLIGVLKLRDAAQGLRDLHSRAAAFLYGPRIISEPGATFANLIARYLAGAAWDDAELRKRLSLSIVAAQREAAKHEGAEGPAHDARLFYKKAAALLQEIQTGVSTGRV
jgi:tetratricopeptide (TPR) repeat protein